MNWLRGFLIAMVAIFAGVVELQRRKRNRAAKAQQAEEPITYQTPIRMNIDHNVLPAPQGAIPAGLTLTMRTNSFAIVGPSSRLSWYLAGSGTTMEADNGWIAVTFGEDDGEPLDGRIHPTGIMSPGRLWLAPPGNACLDAWAALVRAGVTAIGGPPKPS
jgi:hypothetical protein